MRKGDFIWLGIFVVIAAFLVYPQTNAIFLRLTSVHTYLMGFIKFFILASMGDWLGGRIVNGKWEKPRGAFYRSVVWGFIGMAIALMFPIYSTGVATVTKKGLLPASSYPIVAAFFISLINNLTFGFALMCCHRFTDTYIDLLVARKAKPALDEVISNLGTTNLIKFVLFKVLPFFWIPAHTITFMLPSEYRVLFAAALGIALGFFLSYPKKKSVNVTT